MTAIMQHISLAALPAAGTPGFWLGVGFLGQAIFGSRFLCQWIVSEVKKESTMPLAFWYLSLAGGVTLFIYATYRRDPVFMAGQAGGLLIYTRNLVLIHKKRTMAENQ